MPASEAGELSLTATIPFVHIATAIARPTGVARIHKHQCDTSPLRLVDQELSQLSETPIMLLAALPSSNRYPVADVGQIFQHQRGLRVFGIRHKLLRDCMVHPALKPGLLPGELLQTPLRTLGPGGLVGLAVGGTALADDLNRLSRVAVPIRIHGNVRDTQVNPQKARGLNR